MKKFSLILLALMTLVFLAACGENLPGTIDNEDNNFNNVTIEGVVEDENGQAVADAEIVVKDNNTVLGTTTTDAAGAFSISVERTFTDSYFVEARKNVSDGQLTQTILLTSSSTNADFTGNNSLKKEQIASNPVQQ